MLGYKLKKMAGVFLAAFLALGAVGWIAYQGLAANQTDPGTATGKGIALPNNPNAAVITLDFQGGFTPPRQKRTPYLIITANGTVKLGNPFGQAQAAETRISQKELQDLLKFAINDNKFFAFNAAKAKQAVNAEAKKKGSIIAISDASTTVIRIQTAKKTHEAKYYALSMVAGQYPNVQELARLHAIEKRLQRLMNEIRAGGKKGVATALKLANTHLQKKYPKAKPLAAEDLRSAFVRNTGDKYVSFYRLGDKKGTYVSVNIQTPKGGNPKVTVNAKLQ